MCNDSLCAWERLMGCVREVKRGRKESGEMVKGV